MDAIFRQNHMDIEPSKIGIQELTWVNQQALEISRDGLAQMIEMGGYRRVIERTCKNIYFTELDDGKIYRTAQTSWW